MLNKVEKSIFFLTSYIPLWLIFLLKIFFISENESTKFFFKNIQVNIKSFNFSIEIKFLISVIIIMFVYWSLQRLKKIIKLNRGYTVPINIKKVKSISMDYLTNYLSLYLFPFFALNSTDFVNIFVLLIIIILAGYIYVKNDILYINPILNFLGYYIYIIEISFDGIENTEEVIFITYKKREDILGRLDKVRKFEKDIYFEPKLKTNSTGVT